MKYVLECWGGWAASEGGGTDYSSIAAGFKTLLPPESNQRPSCTDNDGIIIDNCIARLKKFKPNEYELVVAHYRYNVSLRTIARRRNCADGTIRKEMQTAEGFIAGVLCMLDVKLEMD
jgi:hypothetical protein